jgi:hypothetical protein
MVAARLQVSRGNAHLRVTIPAIYGRLGVGYVWPDLELEPFIVAQSTRPYPHQIDDGGDRLVRGLQKLWLRWL